MYHMTSVAVEIHRREVAQLAGDAAGALQEQANNYANAQQRQRQVATQSVEDMANYMSAKQATESQQSQATILEMRRFSLSTKRRTPSCERF